VSRLISLLLIGSLLIRPGTAAIRGRAVMRSEGAPRREGPKGLLGKAGGVSSLRSTGQHPSSMSEASQIPTV
jgi:hypothetical protein